MKKEYFEPTIELKIFKCANVILASIDGEWDVEGDWVVGDEIL